MSLGVPLGQVPLGSVGPPGIPTTSAINPGPETQQSLLQPSRQVGQGYETPVRIPVGSTGPIFWDDFWSPHFGGFTDPLSDPTTKVSTIDLHIHIHIYGGVQFMGVQCPQSPVFL